MTHCDPRSQICLHVVRSWWPAGQEGRAPSHLEHPLHGLPDASCCQEGGDTSSVVSLAESHLLSITGSVCCDQSRTRGRVRIWLSANLANISSLHPPAQFPPQSMCEADTDLLTKYNSDSLNQPDYFSYFCPIFQLFPTYRMPIHDWEIFADESEYSRSSFKYVNLKNLMSYERNKNTQVTGITEAVQLQLILRDGPGLVRAGENSPIFDTPTVSSQLSAQFCSVPPSYFVSTFPNCCCHNQRWTIQSKTIKTFKREKMNVISFHLLRVKMNACLLLWLII